MNGRGKDAVSIHSIRRTMLRIYCVVVTLCVAFVLLFPYDPRVNSLGALGSVCMDVISIAVILILVLSLTFEKRAINRTTGWFIMLMIGTITALFFDFLNWAFDGLLQYSDWTNVFTLSSLCCGSVLAAILVVYLGFYMEDMYGVKASALSVKICVACNTISFIITFILGVTKMAFVFVDGHYELGALYDVITVIPILTMICMAVNIARNVKIIGWHDVGAVIGYMLTMICGVVIEAIYGIGATYVGIAIADIFIFIMLQNKHIDRVNKQKDVLADRIMDQYEILESMAGIYSYVNYIDFEEKSSKRFGFEDSISSAINMDNNPHSDLNIILYDGIVDEDKKQFWSYTDLSTLPERMAGVKIISAEFRHKVDGWFRAHYIRIGDSVDQPLNRVIYTIRNIDEEKKNIEKWIRRSNTDELTDCYNRYAYEEEITALNSGAIDDDLVYVSIDVNSLKVTNDAKGHEAGDELLLGAAECMKKCFGPYGKIFRIGGDEFVVIMHADDESLEKVKRELEETTSSWSGELVDEVALSCGYVSYKETEDMDMRQIAVLADKRMYADKAKYYKEKGIDRRWYVGSEQS